MNREIASGTGGRAWTVADVLDADRLQTVPMRPLLPLTAAFGLGIALEHALALSPWPWSVAVALTLLICGVAWWRGARQLLLPILPLAFAGLGAQATGAALFGDPPHHLSRLPEEQMASPVPLEGWIVGPPDPRPAETRDVSDMERTRFVVEVTRLRLGETWVPTAGRARLTVVGEPPAGEYGDEIRGAFHLRRPRRFGNPGAFDYPMYLAAQGISLEGWTREQVEVMAATRGSAILGAIFRMRRRLLQRLDAAMPPPEAGLLKATVLGDRSGLSPEMNQAFLDSGTYHILAISGLNVSLLAGTLFGLFRLLRASPRLAAVASALLVTLYAALAGASPSVIRATVMADACLLAVILDRRGDLLNSLALSALVLLWWNPRVLFDVGFQLTYLATLGILLVLPRCEASLATLPGAVRWSLESVIITLAATAMTLPVLASAFNRVSPVGILANLPIVPLSGLITALGTAASAFLLMIPSGFPWLNQVNGWLVNLLFGVAGWFAAWPWSTVRVYTPTPGMLVAYYGIGVAWLLGASPVRRWEARWPLPTRGSPDAIRPALEPGAGGRPMGSGRAGHRRWAGVLAAACTLALLVQILVRLHPPEGTPRVRLTLLDVGQGEAIFLDLPGRHRMLVDAGGLAGGQFDIGLRVVGPYLLHEWVGHLDVLALTHAQADHINGAPAVLRSFSVGEVWTPDTPDASLTLLWIQEYLRHRRIPHRIVSAGSPRTQWGEATIEVLHPPLRTPRDAWTSAPRSRSNDASLVLKVQIDDQAALLTADIEREGEAALLRRARVLRARVLKVPHHGSRTSSGTAFLAAVEPEVALASLGYRNSFHHPHPDVVERYRAMGVRLLRTDLHGALTVEMTREGMRAWGQRADVQ